MCLSSVTSVEHLDQVVLVTQLFVAAALGMVDAVCVSRLSYASGGLHKPRGRPATHALPGSPRTDVVRDDDGTIYS